MPTRRDLLLAPVVAATAQAQTPVQSAKPNILLILADDLGFGDLSAYGAQDIRTPNIDALIASGVRFDNFYSNSPVCSPTRASLMTGCRPDRAGVPGVIRTHAADSWGYLSPRMTLLPQVLRKSGYHSAIIGKWHLGLESPNTPTERGFDHFHGFLGDMMDDYYNHLRHKRNYLRRDANEISADGQHATDLFTNWAGEYLDSRKTQRSPFFLYLAYNAPHTPIQPTPESLARVHARIQPGTTEGRTKIAALIEHMDDAVGKVIARLKANGQFDNTLIAFTSDNGGDRNAGGTCGNLRGGKQDMYEGGIRVPMCASWPGRIAAGAASSAVAQTMDLFPTLCRVAGVDAPQDIDGVPLLDIWTGKQSSLPERDLVWVRREGNPRYQGRDYYAIRQGDWKLLQNSPFEPYQLFNLKSDPLETTNRAAAEPAVYRKLSAALSLHIQRAARTPWQKPD